MSDYGLQLFDTSGNVIFNTSDKFTRYINSYNFKLSFVHDAPSGYAYPEEKQGYALTLISKTVNVPGIRADGNWGCILTNVSEKWSGSNPLFISNTIINPVIGIDLVTLNWYVAWREAMPTVTGDLMIVSY